MNKKTVVVTGGSKGIGRCIALEYGKHGYNVVINYSTTIPEDLEEQFSQNNIHALFIKADIGKYEEAENLIKQVKNHFSTIDVLVNNAGITKDQLLMRMKEEDFDDVIKTNLKGSFHMMRHVSNTMIKQRSGSIINISSIVGLMGNVGQANYAASKAGLIGLTKSAARELAPRNITCNAIAPGFIKTDMTDQLSEERKNLMLEQIPLKRFGTAEEVAELAYFLSRSKYITGQVISINGGMLMD